LENKIHPICSSILLNIHAGMSNVIVVLMAVFIPRLVDLIHLIILLYLYGVGVMPKNSPTPVPDAPATRAVLVTVPVAPIVPVVTVVND
jgi:hypothetical protein